MRGTPVPVVSDVVMTNSGAVDAVVSNDGALVYVPGTLDGAPRTVVWVDREGRETPIAVPARPYLLPDLSPDGTRLAIFANDRDRDLWLWDLGRTTLTRLTSAAGLDVVQAWTPDSRRIIFTSERAGVRNLFWQAADGTGEVTRLTNSPNVQYPSAVSPDGRLLIFTEEFAQTSIDVMTLELSGTHKIAPLVQSPHGHRSAHALLAGVPRTPLDEGHGRTADLRSAVPGVRPTAGHADGQRRSLRLDVPARAHAAQRVVAPPGNSAPTHPAGAPATERRP
jgi:hypothetical protein